MMIDFALDKQRREGRPAREAIYEACVVRFRPILMTPMWALMGTMPIALGWGAGGASRIRARGHRRSHRFAGADVVPDTGGLSLLRKISGMVSAGSGRSFKRR